MNVMVEDKVGPKIDVCFNDIIPKAKTEILFILGNFVTNSHNLTEFSCTKHILSISQNLFCVHCIKKEKNPLFKISMPNQSEAEPNQVLSAMKMPHI